MKCLFGHKYRPVVTTQGDETLVIRGKITDARTDITILTLKCQRCGKLKQQELIGHLTLEDILGGK